MRLDDVPPDPNSAALMAAIDGMTSGMRGLVREFGFAIVSAMMDDGYYNAKELRPILVEWRRRRQEQWLATDYIVKRSAREIANAIMYRLAERAMLELPISSSPTTTEFVMSDYERARRQQTADDRALFRDITADI